MSSRGVGGFSPENSIFQPFLSFLIIVFFPVLSLSARTRNCRKERKPVKPAKKKKRHFYPQKRLKFIIIAIKNHQHSHITLKSKVQNQRQQRKLQCILYLLPGIEAGARTAEKLRSHCIACHLSYQRRH